MFEGIKTAYEHGKEVGKTYGVRKGVKLYLEEAGFGGALGIVTALGVVLIGMYVIAIVVGSMGNSITANGIINTSSAWGTILSSVDTNARSSFQIANILPIAIVGVGVKSVSDKAAFSPNVHRDRRIQLQIKAIEPMLNRGVSPPFSI
jgi:hypothetical protein